MSRPCSVVMGQEIRQFASRSPVRSSRIFGQLSSRS
jgi:hypothetical protein